MLSTISITDVVYLAKLCSRYPPVLFPILNTIVTSPTSFFPSTLQK